MGGREKRSREISRNANFAEKGMREPRDKGLGSAVFLFSFCIFIFFLSLDVYRARSREENLKES